MNRIQSGRRTGRPNYNKQMMESALMARGGLRTVALQMDQQGVPLRKQVEWLTDNTGVTVSTTTLRTWLQQWYEEVNGGA